MSKNLKISKNPTFFLSEIFEEEENIKQKIQDKNILFVSQYLTRALLSSQILKKNLEKSLKKHFFFHPKSLKEEKIFHQKEEEEKSAILLVF